MMQAVRRLTAGMNPIRARAKVLARENREMRSALVRIRREAGLTQSDVAERMGVTQQAVHKLERYDADPRLSTVERYANAVGALVLHRVIVDRGQSVRMAMNSPWSSEQAVSSSKVVPILERRVEALHGWSQSPTTAVEMVSIR